MHNPNERWFPIFLVVLALLSAFVAVWPLVLPTGSAPQQTAQGAAPTAPPAPTAPTPTTRPTPTAEAALIGELTFAGSTTVLPLAEQLGEVYRRKHPGVTLDIAAGGSVVGIQAVQNGEVDIGMASRKLREEEKETDMQVYRIAVDVLAVIVHPSNEVDELSLEELQGIYLGEITNWEDVGGQDVPILPVVREITSGTRGAFDDIVLDDEEPVETADVQVTASEVEARVATTENAIGYIGFGHIEPDEIKVLKIDGIFPSQEAALDDSYKLQRPLQLLTGPLSRDLAQTFVDFALSEEGQAIVVEAGWVPAREHAASGN